MGKVDRKELGEPKPHYKRGQHPNSKKNLEMGMAKPGDVLNPNGKPPGTRDRKTTLQKWIDLQVTFPNRNKHGQPIFKELGQDISITVEDEIDLALILEAKKGNIAAIKEIKDSLYGKIAEKNEHSGPDGGPIPQKFVVEVVK